MSEADYQGFIQEDGALILPISNAEPGGEIQGSNSFALETHLEDFIVRNFKRIFKESLTIYVDVEGAVGQQFDTDIGRIDILAHEQRTNSFVVIELKRDKSSDQVVGQILRYMGWVKSKLCTDGQTVRGLIISGEPDRKLDYALSMINNIEVQYYEVDFKLR